MHPVVAVGRWWRRRSLRARLTLLASGALAAGLVAGAALLAIGFAASRVRQVGVVAKERADTVAELVRTDQLPAVLPSAPNELVQVLDTHAQVLAASPTASRTLALLSPEQLSRIRRGGDGSVTRTPLVEGPVRIVAEDARLVGSPVTVVVAVPISDVLAVLRALRILMSIVVPLLVGAVALVCWLLVGSALRPVAALRSGADAVTDVGGGGVLPVPPAPDTDEVAALARTLNRMLDRLRDAGQRQRAFVADAAHELRSPLASLRTQLEVAELTGPSPGVMPDLLAEVLRLGRLVEDLLVLARLDGMAVGRHRERVDLAAMALEAGAPAVSGSGSALAEPDVVRRILRNLVDNATRHARDRVAVTVADGWVTVDDDGQGIPVPDRGRVFERFTRLDDARARDAGGSGLGLAIARESARAADGDVVVEDSPWGGARLTVTLPVGGPD